MKAGNDSNQLNYHSKIKDYYGNFPFYQSILTLETVSQASSSRLEPLCIVVCHHFVGLEKFFKKKVHSEEDNKSDAKPRLPSNKSGSFFVMRTKFQMIFDA